MNPIVKNPLDVPFYKNLNCSIDLNFFEESKKEKINIKDFKSVKLTLKKIAAQSILKHRSARIYFYDYTSKYELQNLIKIFKKFSFSENLQYSICNYKNSTIIAKLKPINEKILKDGTTLKSYISGTKETFRIKDNFYFVGTRVFSNGIKEKGLFCRQSLILKSGYRIKKDKNIEFVNPEDFSLSFYQEYEGIKTIILEVENRLKVLRKIDNKKYKLAEESLIKVLLKAALFGKEIKKILFHKDFKKLQESFLNLALSLDKNNIPRIFRFPMSTALDLLEIGTKIKPIDPIKIVNPHSKVNLFHRAMLKIVDLRSLERLIRLFPLSFKSFGKKLILKLLLKNKFIRAAFLFEKFKDLNIKIDPYHSICFQSAFRKKPNEEFKKILKSLSDKQKKVIYELAYIHNNPFIHEPPKIPVKRDQYSINLMWINKRKIPENQIYLFGDGDTEEKRALDFHNKFIKPVSNWAIKNPGSSINIWVDSKMATRSAIENSEKILKKNLSEKVHEKVRFRDVRDIDIVTSNENIFSENMHIYFRVDLLRAIIADYILRKKETQYFVYGDIDMKAMNRDELFDKRSVNSLDKIGIVMAKGGSRGFENGFQILNGKNSKFMDSHKKVIIDLNIEMASLKPEKIQEQQIYDCYSIVIAHLFYIKKGKKDDSSIFRYDNFYNHFISSRFDSQMPKKPVQLPPSHFG